MGGRVVVGHFFAIFVWNSVLRAHLPRFQWRAPIFRSGRIHLSGEAEAGAVVSDGVPVEISPLFADSPVVVIEKIEKGQRFEQATCLW